MRLKALVLAVFAAYWVTVVGILVADRTLFDQAMRQLGAQLLQTTHGDLALADAFAVTVLTLLLAILSIGVIRSWRWTFWLILVAFLVNVIRVPVAALQLLGIGPRQGPTWIVALQVVVGLVQVAVGIAMLRRLPRRLWGEF